ncbi:ABC transporter permease [Bacillus fonticola]|uniref:ABC transporter permease n=1 Tax=Bacillus fonticola TaxID=2728853 RepID=UPI0014749797|nr:ABC transporter permease [Bacillus fonticola]
MFASLFGSVELGLIYGLMALGVYLSFRVLDFPDLTVDGSFVTGAAVAATMITIGYSPLLATIVSIFAGFFAGCLTGLLHTKGKINSLLAGILMMIALYSINLRIMGATLPDTVGRPNIPLLNTETLFTPIERVAEGMSTILNGWVSSLGLGESNSTWGIFFTMLLIVCIVKLLVDVFLKTEVGLALRATGDNERMIRSLSANTDLLKIVGLGLSNALVAFSGALVAQYSSFADIGMGVGMIIIGLASVIIGEALFGTKSIVRTTFAVIGGAIIYRSVIGLALRYNVLDAADTKLITAGLVIVALIAPGMIDKRRQKRRKQRYYAQREEEQTVVTTPANQRHFS